jgi:ATP-dependent helicase/nuclease subunit B
LAAAPIIFLTPRQATFSAERELACNPRSDGYFRARVVSFEQLGHDIIEECGGAAIPEVTSRGRQMLLGHLLQRHRGELRYFQTAAEHRSLATKLDATFNEFERAGQDAGQLDSLLHDLSGHDDSGRSDKIHDLALIYRSYTAYLGQERFDQQRRLEHVLRLLNECKSFAGATVYCDGFLEFTDYERQILTGLAKRCRHVTITLPMDAGSVVINDPDLLPPEQSLFHKTEIAYRRLRLGLRDSKIPVESPLVLRPTESKFLGAGLHELERSFDRFPVSPSRNSDGVEMLEAPDRAAEVQAAARRILKMVAGGWRFRDIGVLVRSLPDYLEPITIYFREHRIPFFADYRRPSDYHPLLQFVRALLAISKGDWPHDAMMQLLKTDLTGLSTAQADQLENYVLRHRIRGERWASVDPWNYEEQTETEGLRQSLLNKLRPLVGSAEASATLRQRVLGLFDTLEKFGIRQRLSQWISAAERENHLEEMEEHQQVWAELVKLFDEMVDLLGDEAVSPGDFQEILEAGLETFDLGLTPPTVDQVLVGQIDRTRTPQLRGVLVLGLNEKCFPRRPEEDSVLSDSEIRFFQDRKLEVGQPCERLILDENLLAYLAFTSASEVLHVSRARSDSSGRVLATSRYWNFIRALLPDAGVTSIGQRGDDDAGAISTPRELVGALAQWVRRGEVIDGLKPRASSRLNGGNVGVDDSPWPGLYQWMSQSVAGDSQYRAWGALTYENRAVLSPTIAARLFPLPLHTTAKALESFAACSFQHFAAEGLNLQPRETGDISALDSGQAYHQVLQTIVQQLVKTHQSWQDLDDAQRQRVIANAAKELGEKIRGEVFLSTARNRYLLSHIERTLNRVVQTQKALASRSSFKPGFTRAGFGQKKEMPHLVLPMAEGGEIYISGSIDRIDLHEEGEFCSVIDYRLGEHKLSLTEAYYGLSLHLLVCLLAVESHGDVLCGRKLTPAAAFYMRMLRGLGDVDHPEQAAEPDSDAFHLASKPRGIFDERVVQSLDRQVAPGESSLAINARMNKDGSFGSRDKSDVANSKELAALLHHVRRWIAALAQRIATGDISVRPYMLGDDTPCPKCDYRAVCRFQASEGYRILPPMKRSQVLEMVAEEVEIDEAGQ